MKLLTIILLLLATPVLAFTPPDDGYVASSGENTADASVLKSAGYLYSMVVATDGTNNVTFDLYDNASAASGDKLLPSFTIVTATTNVFTAVNFKTPLAYNKGVYVDITTSGTVGYTLYYRNN